MSRKGVAITSGSENLKAPAKLCEENLQKSPWEGLQFFSTFYSLGNILSLLYYFLFSIFIHTMQHFTMKTWKNLLHNMNEKVKKCCHVFLLDFKLKIIQNDKHKKYHLTNLNKLIWACCCDYNEF
jgi:hypothetical protein